MQLRGLHHVTAICSDMERTIAFYRDTLGLSIAHDAPSDDDPDARHVWFDGGEGTYLSFMEYGAMPEGVVGIGSTHHFALRVETTDEQEAWRDYLRERGVDCTEVLQPRRLPFDLRARPGRPRRRDRYPRAWLRRRRAVRVAVRLAGAVSSRHERVAWVRLPVELAARVHCAGALSSIRWSSFQTSGSTRGTGDSAHAPSGAGSRAGPRSPCSPPPKGGPARSRPRSPHPPPPGA